VSFDLYAFDIEALPTDEMALGGLLEDESQWGHPLTDRLATLVRDLEMRYPGLDDDPDGSPWSSWPLGESMMGGHCCGFNIAGSAADQVAPHVTEACQAMGLSLYNPQQGTVIGPAVCAGADRPQRRFWRRTT
jgi:hypothetical protein